MKQRIPPSLRERRIVLAVKVCRVCGGQFECPQALSDRYLTCSPACESENRHTATTTTFKCEECGQAFDLPSNATRRGKRPVRFCSNPCRMAALQRIPRPRKGQGSGTMDAKGYRNINVVGNDGVVRVGVKEHRWVMEQYLGRPLTDVEVVHHINHDRADNRIENLELFSTHAEHISQRHPENWRGRKPLTSWSRKYPACIICGETDSKHSSRGVCHRCLERQRRASGS